jgi:hypothetical protein
LPAIADGVAFAEGLGTGDSGREPSATLEDRL